METMTIEQGRKKYFEMAVDFILKHADLCKGMLLIDGDDYRMIKKVTKTGITYQYLLSKKTYSSFFIDFGMDFIDDMIMQLSRKLED